MASLDSNKTVYKKYMNQMVLLYDNREDVKIYSELLLSVGAIIIFGLFAVRPTLVTILNLFSEISAKRETIVIMDTKIGNIIAGQTIFERERARLNILSQAIPQEALAEQYIRQLEGLATRNGVTISSLSLEAISVLGESTLEQQTKQFDISFTIAGDYLNVASFLDNIENTRRPLLENAVTTRINKGEITGAVLVSIEGSVPYMITAR